MKKNSLIVILVLLLIAFNIVSCTPNNKKDLFVNEMINYNNIYNHNNLWINGADIVYSKSGFYNTKIYHHKNDEKITLISDSDLEGSGSIDPRIQSFNDYVYFYRQTNNEVDIHKYEIYKIAINEKNAEAEIVVSSEKPIFYWTIVDDNVVFLTTNDYNSDYTYSLWYCTLDGSTSQKISDKAGSFGIMGEKLVFIEESSEKLSILGYDFSTFNCDELGVLDKFEKTIRWHQFLFNYTEERIVFVNLNNPREVHVYDMDNKNENVYTIEHPIVDMSCYNEQAYFLTGNKTYTYPSTDMEKKSCVYKMDLTNGTTSLITDEYDKVEGIYASTNDYVYLVNYVGYPLSSYEVVKISDDGTVKKVYKY